MSRGEGGLPASLHTEGNFGVCLNSLTPVASAEKQNKLSKATQRSSPVML